MIRDKMFNGVDCYTAVMNEDNDQEEGIKHYEEEQMVPKLRAKRNSVKPQRFKNFVM